MGCGGDRSMSHPEIWANLEACAARALPREQIALQFGRLKAPDKVMDMSPVTPAAADQRSAPTAGEESRIYNQRHARTGGDRLVAAGSSLARRTLAN